MSDPILTIVATARNDDHGGNLLGRMQLFVTNLLEQCKRYQLQAELILVDWNPPHDKPRLIEALAWPTAKSPCTVYIIEVPSAVHHQFQYAEQLPLFQMIAKNVGIRQAHGKFVLVTNVDILFSNELIRFLATPDALDAQYMYRVDRYDVLSDVPLAASIDERLAYCHQNVIRINSREHTLTLQSGHIHGVHAELSWFSKLHEKAQDMRLLPITRWSRLHTNASGDFTLMARDHWFALRGYPEFEMYSFHLDSVFCHAAHHHGAQEYVLPDPMRTYHIEHAVGSGWTPEGQEKLAKRLDAVKVPQLEHDKLMAWAIQMRKEQKAIIFNDENWGLADHQLKKVAVTEEVKP